MFLATAAMSAISAIASTAAGAASTAAGALGIGGTAAATAAPLSLTGGAAGVAASGAGAAGMFGGSTWLTLLQGGMGALSAMESLNAGKEQARSLNLAAADANNQAAQEKLAGTQRQAGLKRQTADYLAERSAAYEAGGIDLSFGTPEIAKSQDIADTERALAIDESNTQQQTGRLGERASEFRRSAQSAKRGAMIKAFTSGADMFLSMNRRGSFQTPRG